MTHSPDVRFVIRICIADTWYYIGNFGGVVHAPDARRYANPLVAVQDARYWGQYFWGAKTEVRPRVRGCPVAYGGHDHRAVA